MAKPTPWTDDEIDACIGIYLLMRAAVEIGQKINKRAIIREVQTGPLSARSRGSIEAKMMNVSAVLRDIGRTDLSMQDHGYKAWGNYQAALKARVTEIVDGQTLEDIVATATELAA